MQICKNAKLKIYHNAILWIKINVLKGFSMNYLVRLKKVTVSLIVFLTLISSAGCEEGSETGSRAGPETDKVQPRLDGICQLEKLDNSFILDSVGGLTVDESMADFLGKKADNTKDLESAEFARNSLNELVGVKKQEVIKMRLAFIVRTSPDSGALGFLRCLPYVGLVETAVGMLIGLSQPGCNESEAIARFVADSINVAHNENLKNIWKNAVQDAKDELKDIQVSASGLIRANKMLLNSFQYTEDDDVSMTLVAESLMNGFTNNFSGLLDNMYGFQNRVNTDPGSNWALASATAYKEFIELTLQLYKAHLSAARGIDMDYFAQTDPERAACFKGATGVAYGDYFSFVKDIMPLVGLFKDINSHPDAFGVNFICDSKCWDVDNDDWTINMFGTVDANLYGNSLIRYSKHNGHRLQILDLMGYLPEDEQKDVPMYKRTHVVGSRVRKTVTYNFDDDGAWPGRYVTERTGIKNATRRVYRPYNKWLGKGEDGFWNHVFNTRRAHDKYYEFKDAEISALSSDTKRMINEVKVAYVELAENLDKVSSEIEKCPNDTEYDSLMVCTYFSEPVMDAIKFAAQKCVSPFYFNDELQNFYGAHVCVNNCDCNGARICGQGNICQDL